MSTIGRTGQIEKQQKHQTKEKRGKCTKVKRERERDKKTK